MFLKEYPVSLMEAMSFKIPVIATDCGATRELVDGKSGILVNEKDPEAVTNAIIKFINNYLTLEVKWVPMAEDKVMQDFDTLENLLKT
jgi:glycosyltransferase involved in cell wall biosynthesis